MVSRATKRIWKSVALGLALSPGIGATGVALGQTSNPPFTAAAAKAPGTTDVAPANDVETCRRLVQEGRAALKAGDKVKAEKLARQAAAMHVSFPYWEPDTAEKLLLDIGVKTTPPPPNVVRKADPHLLVKQGQDALKAGRVEDAQKLAQQAKMVPNTKWGMFEETPEKLLDEVQKARATRDKTEATRLLVEGRKLYTEGKYDEAQKAAYKASSMHGPYGVWDFGDKPEKLLADIQTARDKTRKTKLPPAPTATVTNKPMSNKPAANGTIQQASAPAPSWPTEVKTADVKGPDLGSKVTNAAATAAPGVPMPVMPAGGPLMPSNSMPAAPPLPTPVAAVPMPTPPVPAPAPMNPARMQAMQCLKEGHEHEAAGRYLEARTKYQEALRCGAEFGPTDDSPDRCLMDLSAAVVARVNAALKETGPQAEGKLAAARALAVGFALDARAIDNQLATMKGAATAAARTVANDAASVGSNLLDKARLELRRGQTEAARQLATEVHNGPFGMQAEAVLLLRTIDVEEHNQQVLAANRTLDAGLAAYRGKELGQALVIFQQVDPSMLAPEKRVDLKRIMDECSRGNAVVQAPTAPMPPPPPGGNIVPVGVPPGSPAGTVTTAASKGVTGLQGPMPKMTAPVEGDSLAAQVHAMQDIEYQKLRQDGLEVQTRALQMWERGETDAALEALESYKKKVKASQLDATSVARLQKPIDAKIANFRLLKTQKDDTTQIASSKKNFLDAKTEEMSRERKKIEQVKALMKQYDTNFKEGKYEEAKVCAYKAQALDPDDSIIRAAVQVAENKAGLTKYDTIRQGREEMFKTALDDAESEGPPVDQKEPLKFDKVRMQIANKRTGDGKGFSTLRTQSSKEKEIQAKLGKSIQVNFHNVPLRQAIDDVRKTTGMNVYVQNEALAAEAVNPEMPVSIEGDLTLKSALKLMLEQAHLTYIVKDDMLQITTPRAAKGKQERRVFSVADLVIPIDDYILPDYANVNKAFQKVQESGNVNLNGGKPTTNRMNMLQNGESVGTGSNSMSTTPGGEASMKTTNVQPGSTGSTMSHVAAVAPTKLVMQDTLIKLIVGSVAPETWVDAGGSGTIEYMPIGMALVINQTPDVQEQVADLFNALRRLQDLQVAVEIRMITLAETFFERIGLDFALNIKTDKSTAQYQPQLTTNNFAAPGQINAFNPKNFISGITGIGNNPGTGSFTSDLNIPIHSSSFQYAIPPFGGYPNNPGFDGGLSLGLAFLSDIQVYMFMEAAQGDRRTNVMQAPKLTLFNGQTSTINVNDQQFFVTNVNVVGFGGQIVFVPINQGFPLGVSVTIQAVVSADRRFVRLNLAPNMTNLASAIVPLFPVTTFITPVFEGGAQGQPIPFTQFVQQPTLTTVGIQTTVSIPDGGTVILGGMKTLSEGRNEFGPPVLSKLPYIDRLFKNVGYGREAQSLLLMVTPRIIINAEEEERQTGEIGTGPSVRTP